MLAARRGDQTLRAESGRPATAGMAQAYTGNAAWIDYGLISGRWYRAPGEVDVNTAFLSQSGLAVGDTVTVNTGTSTGAAQVTAWIAGEVFDPSGGDPHLFGSAQTLPGVATAANLQQYDEGLRPGSTAAGYIQTVNRALGANSGWQATPPDGGQFYSIAIGLVGLLALMVAAAAGLGRAQHGADDDPGPGARPGDLQGARDAARPDAHHGGVLDRRPPPCWPR